MSEAAKWTVVGVMVAVVLAGAVVGAVGIWPGKNRPDHAKPSVTMVRLGPDGTAKSSFKEDQKDVAIPKSRGYDLCLGELRVQRPSMMTTDMPDAFCTVTRKGNKGPWRISTGGWQQCQAVCVKLGRKS